MHVLETDRLILRRLLLDDADFILRLLNEPSWLRFIGDRGVRNTEDARGYIESGPQRMYSTPGLGLHLVELKGSAQPMGLCGLIKRDSLPDVDIGFAFLPEWWSHGYAFEAASAMVSYGRQQLGLQRIVAITAPDNIASAKLLERLGMRFECLIKLSSDAAALRMFATV